MPRPSTARRAERSTRPRRNSHGRHPHGHAGDGVPLAAFPGDGPRHSRTPARQRAEAPWNPGTAAGGPRTAGQSLGFNSRSPRRVTPRRLSLRLRSMAPLGRHHCASAHLPRCTPAGSAYASRDMQDMYSVQRNILPGRSRDVRTAPKSLPQNRATALPAVARTPDMEVSPGLFRHLCSRGQAPRRPAWRGRSPLP